MAVNPWLSAQSYLHSETDLFDNLVAEAIQHKGIDVNYLIRKQENSDFLFSESTTSSFRDKFVIEMYLQEIIDFNGQGDMFSKFGTMFDDGAHFQVSAKRFREESKNNGYDIDRPREGDLIFIPFANALFEITRVEQDPDFYQVGKNYRYVVKCKVFKYSHEEFEEDTDEADLIDFSSTSMEETLGISSKNKTDISHELQNNGDEKLRDVQFDIANPFGDTRK